jgi:hypothetical protein
MIIRSIGRWFGSHQALASAGFISAIGRRLYSAVHRYTACMHWHRRTMLLSQNLPAEIRCLHLYMTPNDHDRNVLFLPFTIHCFLLILDLGTDHISLLMTVDTVNFILSLLLISWLYLGILLVVVYHGNLLIQFIIFFSQMLLTIWTQCLPSS